MRKIIHIDCDCFFAAVEMRDDPSLVGKPMAVGGSEKQRGVLATCNYEARQFGLHSAMPTARAFKLCPELILRPARFEVYKSVSLHIHSIFKRYTELIEPLSLDEAFLDVSESRQCGGSATLIAQEIRVAIANELGITASAGVANNKFIAKIASDWQKPNGQTVVTPQCVEAFIAQLSVDKIPGVGPATMKKMQALQVKQLTDLRLFSQEDLLKHFGKFGQRLHNYAQGIDNRPVNPERERKSLSVERTFSENLVQLSDLHAPLQSLFEKLQARLSYFYSTQLEKQFCLKNNVLVRNENKSKLSIKLIANLQIKVKFFDFSQISRERQCELVYSFEPHKALTLEDFIQLIDDALAHYHTDNGLLTKSIRLLGLGVGFSTLVLEGGVSSLSGLNDQTDDLQQLDKCLLEALAAKREGQRELPKEGAWQLSLF